MSTYGEIGLGAVVVDRGLAKCGDAYRRSSKYATDEILLAPDAA